MRKFTPRWNVELDTCDILNLLWTDLDLTRDHPVNRRRRREYFEKTQRQVRKGTVAHIPDVVCCEVHNKAGITPDEIVAICKKIYSDVKIHRISQSEYKLAYDILKRNPKVHYPDNIVAACSKKHCRDCATIDRNLCEACLAEGIQPINRNRTAGRGASLFVDDDRTRPTVQKRRRNNKVKGNTNTGKKKRKRRGRLPRRCCPPTYSPRHRHIPGRPARRRGG